MQDTRNQKKFGHNLYWTKWTTKIWKICARV